MAQHLTEKELIEYQFKLAEDADYRRMQAHLQRCELCSAALRGLAERFSVLELLRGQATASDELIGRTLDGLKTPDASQIAHFDWRRWVLAAAAVVMVGAGLLIMNYTGDDPARHGEYAKKLDSPAESLGVGDERSGEEGMSALSRRVAREPLADKGTGDAPAAPELVVAVKPRESLMEDVATLTSGLPEADAARAVGRRGAALDVNQMLVAKDFDAEAGRMAPLRYGPAETETFDGEAAHDARTRMGVTGLGQAYGFRADGMAEEPRPWAFAGGGMGGMGGMGGFGAAPTDLALGEDPFGRPPFAPASAIELVVLPRRDSVQLTIYNSADLTLVRERRNLTLKRGWNWLQFMWANTLIDPTSLHLEPLERAGEIEVQQLVYPARLSQIGRWLIRSQYEGQAPFEITYFTSGLSWRAFYMGTLSTDETKMALEGYVRVDNASGEDYEQAQTRLIVGQVHLLDEIAALARRQRPYGPDPVVADAEGDHAWGEWGWTNLYTDYALSMNGVLAVGDVFFGTGKPKEIRKEGLSEYFLYTIEGTETIANQWGKRLGSFSAEDVNVTSLYKYDEERWGHETIRFVSFANDEEHNLGQTPLPNGDVRIYAVADAAGGLSYVGGTQVKYIPVNEKVELNLGPDRLVKVEPKLMAFDTRNHTFDYQRNVNGWDEVRTWRIELTNTRELPVDIEITRGFETSYWDLTLVDPASMAADAVGYEKHDATHGRFKTTVQPRSLKSFGYTVRTYHGERERAWK